MRKLGRIIALVCFIVAPAACGDDDNEPNIDAAPFADGAPNIDGAVGGPDAAATSNTVIAMSNMFMPMNMTVRVGDTVTWRNDDATMHTVTSGASSMPADMPGTLFDQALNPGDTFQFTFTTAGSQPYFCRIHELLGMKGTITVNP